jgi:hypothetical protein
MNEGEAEVQEPYNGSRYNFLSSPINLDSY